VSAATTTAPKHVEAQPHRRWYRRPEIVVPVVLVAAGYALLIVGVEENTSFSSRMTAQGGLDFDWMYFWHLVPLMLRGLFVTAKATVLGFTLAAVLGFFLALGRRAPSRLISWPTAGLIEFIRSTPLLVQLFFWQAFVRATGLITIEGARSIGFSRSLLILTLGLGIHYGTYCSEAYRAGMESVPKGQWEASTALNLDPVTKWTKIIIPQAVPNALPALGNFLVASFKDAPMGFIVGVPGILFFANTIRGEDFRVTEPFFLVGVGFLMASLPAAWAVRRLEERIAYERT
jgi:polar amino acid transport system permease protein